MVSKPGLGHYETRLKKLTLAMASIAGLYGNFTSQEDGGGGRTIFLRGLRIPVGDKKSDGKKSSQNPGPPTDAAHNQASRGGNDE